MNALKRHLILLVLVGTPLVCGVVTAVKFQANVTRQNRNRALIAAIEANKPAEAIRLLASGADANARELPEDTRTFWQKVREIWRPVKVDVTAYPTALTLALRGEMVLDNANAPETRFQLFKALHDAGAKEDGRFALSQADLNDAEKAIKEAPDTPVGVNSPTSGLRNADVTLIDALSKSGMSAEAMLDLADCQFRGENYTDAVYTYRIAALWQPNDANLQARLAQAQEYERTAERINRTLPAGYRIFSIRPYSASAPSAAWVALYGVYKEGYLYHAQVALYQADGAELRQICRAPLNSKEQAGDRDASKIYLYVFSLTGRAVPEILLSHYFSYPDGHSASLDVFSCEGGKFTNLASMHGDFSLVLEKAPHGNRRIIRRENGTDDGWPGGATPIRPDLYAFNGRRFAFADAEFPYKFNDYIKEAEKALHKNPADYDLLQNLAYAYSITGSPQKAEQYYRDAERLCRRTIAEQGKDVSKNDRKILAQIVARDPERHL